jgi:hypothetical protein
MPATIYDAVLPAPLQSKTGFLIGRKEYRENDLLPAAGG